MDKTLLLADILAERDILLKRVNFLRASVKRNRNTLEEYRGWSARYKMTAHSRADHDRRVERLEKFVEEQQAGLKAAQVRHKSLGIRLCKEFPDRKSKQLMLAV